VLIGDVGKAVDGSQIQYNKVRINGQPSVYVPILKSGGDANTIEVVNGVKRVVAHLLDVPKNLVTQVVFDQSVFVRTAIETLVHEGTIGLVLTGLMILISSAACGRPSPSFFPFRSPPRRLHCARNGRRHHQCHDPRRAGAGFFPFD